MDNVCSINNLAACLVQSGVNRDLANLLTTLGGVVLVATVPLVTVIFLIWIERKIAARVQDRRDSRAGAVVRRGRHASCLSATFMTTSPQRLLP